MKHMPELTDELNENDLEYEELCDLWISLVTEILDPEFTTRTHGNRRTYDSGCKGPMCKAAARQHGRRRNTGSPIMTKYFWMEAITEYWRPLAEMMILERVEGIVLELTSV